MLNTLTEKQKLILLNIAFINLQFLMHTGVI